MSTDHAPRQHDAKPAKISHSGNGGMKWLAAGVAAAVLLGGGYYAWTKTNSNQVAANDASEYSAPYVAGPAEGFDTIEQDKLVENGDAAPGPAASFDSPAQPAAAPVAKAKPAPKRVAAAATPVETIGVPSDAQTMAKSDDVIVNAPKRAVWTRKPSAERLATYYPAYALERGREGEAQLSCMVQERGNLKCERVSETPARQGFGTAAMQVSRTLRHAPTRADGSNAIGTPVNLRVMFRMAEGERG